MITLLWWKLILSFIFFFTIAMSPPCRLTQEGFTSYLNRIWHLTIKKFFFCATYRIVSRAVAFSSSLWQFFDLGLQDSHKCLLKIKAKQWTGQKREKHLPGFVNFVLKRDFEWQQKGWEGLWGVKLDKKGKIITFTLLVTYRNVTQCKKRWVIGLVVIVFPYSVVLVCE